jgi:hypothetical protein
MVAGEDQNIAGTWYLKLIELLAQRVRRPLIPGLAHRRLFRRQNPHPPAGEVVELVGAHHVPVQGDGIVLREYVNTINAGVNTIADRDIDEPVIARQWNGRFCAQLGQWIKPVSCAPTHNHSQYVFHEAQHGRSPFGVYVVMLLL